MTDIWNKIKQSISEDKYVSEYLKNDDMFFVVDVLEKSTLTKQESADYLSNKLDKNIGKSGLSTAYNKELKKIADGSRVFDYKPDWNSMQDFIDKYGNPKLKRELEIHNFIASFNSGTEQEKETLCGLFFNERDKNEILINDIKEQQEKHDRWMKSIFDRTDNLKEDVKHIRNQIENRFNNYHLIRDNLKEEIKTIHNTLIDIQSNISKTKDNNLFTEPDFENYEDNFFENDFDDVDIKKDDKKSLLNPHLPILFSVIALILSIVAILK